MTDTTSKSTIEGADTDSMKELRRGYNELAYIIKRSIPEGRRRSIALTELETSSMYAMKALTVRDE